MARCRPSFLSPPHKATTNLGFRAWPRFPAERAGPGKEGEAIGPGAWDQLTARFDPAWFNIGTRCAPRRRVGDAQAGYWHGCQTLPAPAQLGARSRRPGAAGS